MKFEFESTSSRRQFLQTSTVATVGGLAMPFILPGASRGAEVNSDTIKVGLVGCGGRGRGAAGQAMAADKNVVLTAIGDAFEEPLKSCLDTLQKEETAKDKLKVEPDRMFVGLDAFQKVIESGVDVVLLASPPGFRPQHLAAAIKAGKHVFCEKPMATDAPGVRSVLATAEEAKRKKLTLVSGFCWRYDFARRALFEEIHQGRVGDIRAIYGTYYTSPVKPMPPASARKPEWSDVEWQVRNWYNFTWLSGDGLVEQAVHSVNKMAWAMKDVPPLKAVAVGGRQVPAEGGNIYDHIEVNYEYANGTLGFLGCRQQPFCFSQNADYILGTKGIATIGVKPTPEITGENPWRFGGGKNQNMYQTEHDEFFASIRAGKALNDGTWMSHSTLMAIMGRMAAYTGQEITWEQALNSQEVLVPANLNWKDSLAVAPMAIPGKTKFI